MTENYIMYKGKRYELTEDQFKSLGIKEDPFDIQDRETYYYIDHDGVVTPTTFIMSLDARHEQIANACKDKLMMEKRAMHEELNRLLWKFSIQHDGEKINVYNTARYKYYIQYDPDTLNYYVESYINACHLGSVVFFTEEIARRAIDEVVIPFMKTHTDFCWNYGGNK